MQPPADDQGDLGPYGGHAGASPVDEPAPALRWTGRPPVVPARSLGSADPVSSAVARAAPRRTGSAYPPPAAPGHPPVTPAGVAPRKPRLKPRWGRIFLVLSL